jgi:hypothetical protein
MQLSEAQPSFAFLVILSLELGNLTAVKPEAVERVFLLTSFTIERSMGTS